MAGIQLLDPLLLFSYIHVNKNLTLGAGGRHHIRDSGTLCSFPNRRINAHFQAGFIWSVHPRWVLFYLFIFVKLTKTCHSELSTPDIPSYLTVKSGIQPLWANSPCSDLGGLPASEGRWMHGKGHPARKMHRWAGGEHKVPKLSGEWHEFNFHQLLWFSSILALSMPFNGTLT